MGLYDPFLAITLLEILGGRMHGPFPTSHFGATVPQPPKSLPMMIRITLLILRLNLLNQSIKRFIDLHGMKQID